MARMQAKWTLSCLLALSSLAVVACANDDDHLAEVVSDAGRLDAGNVSGRDAGNAFDLDAERPDGSVTPPLLKSCLDSPSLLSTPPSVALPCELVAPNF